MLGILGGGQLGRMTLQAASRLGIDVLIAELTPDAPAARMTSASIVFDSARGGWSDPIAQHALAQRAKVVTLESEFVDARALTGLERLGVKVRPTSVCMAVVQDKLRQKAALAQAALPVPQFREITRPEDLVTMGDELGWPLMLKARRDGYDGRGNVLVSAPEQASGACARLGWPERELLAEELVPFERELAVIVVRDLDGASVTYPVVETRQDPLLHICREVLAPADIDLAAAERAEGIARGAVEAVDGVGAFGVEMFLLSGGQVVINELAPRPHNSGHYSIEGCWSSQFDNHVRAVLGLPLGDSRMLAPAAVMINLLGSRTTPLRKEDVAKALRVPHTFVHLYGKRDNRPGRKMGHVTALGATLEEARARALDAAAAACP